MELQLELPQKEEEQAPSTDKEEGDFVIDYTIDFSLTTELFI